MTAIPQTESTFIDPRAQEAIHAATTKKPHRSPVMDIAVTAQKAKDKAKKDTASHKAARK